MRHLIAEATWWTRYYHDFECDSSEPTLLKAVRGPSGEKITVWLPSGRRCVFRVKSTETFEKPIQRRHRYGAGKSYWDKDNMIQFSIRNLKNDELPLEKPQTKQFKL